MGIEKFFSSRMRQISPKMNEKTISTNHPKIIAVTGSTGNFGAYILDLLLRDEHVSKVYCLNRSANARERQLRSHEDRGLITDFSGDGVIFQQVDFAKPYWGMTGSVLETFLQEVELIIHNAWPVDFNRNFHSFKPQIEGVRHLITMASQTSHAAVSGELSSDSSAKSEGSSDLEASSHMPRRQMRVIFISSVGTVSNWASQAPTSREFVPEAELTDWKLARTGYGQSKLLSERLLCHAARQMGLPIHIIRVGQLAGPVMHGDKGQWPVQEWLPSLIKSSTALKLLPYSLGPSDIVDWVPVDLAARVLLELLNVPCALLEQSANSRSDAVFSHIVNPRRTSWSAISSSILGHCPQTMRQASLSEWVDALRMSAERKDQQISTKQNPAAKLIDSTFGHMQDRAIRFPDARAAILDTAKTAKRSQTLRVLQEVNVVWMDMWMRQWSF